MSAHPQVFLISPLDSKAHREVIVYADDEVSARRAASSKGSLYNNKGMATCITIDPIILKTEADELTIKYNEVIYHLSKDEAQWVIAEEFL